jgi:hypothetical protein
VANETVDAADLSVIQVVDTADDAMRILKERAIDRFGLTYEKGQPKRRWFLFER